MPGEIRVGYEGKFLLQQSGWALAQGGQGGDGVTDPGGVLEPWTCGTEGCGDRVQWGWVGVFSNFNDSVTSH